MKNIIVLFTFLILITITTYAKKLTEYLIAYYSFDDSTAKDHSGNGFHGTMVNNPKPDKGVFGTCMRFKGKGVFINSSSSKSLIGDHIQLPLIPLHKFDEFTMSCWVNLENLEYWGGTAYLFFGTVLHRWVGIYHAGKYPTPIKWVKFATGAYDDISEPILYDFNSKDLNTWMHHTLVYKNGYMSVYINGVFFEKKISNFYSFSQLLWYSNSLVVL